MGSQAMLILSFCIGMLLGVFLGVLVVGLCSMASERKRSSLGDPYYSRGFESYDGITEGNLKEVV
jgi:hypothetical protein